jgi:hypothetical protein
MRTIQWREQNVLFLPLPKKSPFANGVGFGK